MLQLNDNWMTFVLYRFFMFLNVAEDWNAKQKSNVFWYIFANEPIFRILHGTMHIYVDLAWSILNASFEITWIVILFP